MARLSENEVRALAEKHSALVPSEFYVRMAKRESDYNPRSTMKEGNGTTSIGLWQVNAEEAKAAGVTGDLYDPDNNATVIAYKMEHNLQLMAQKYSFSVSNPPPDVWYYLAASHNAGLSRVMGWIDENRGRLAWAETKAKHPTFVTIAKGYADYIGDGASGSAGPFALAGPGGEALGLLVAIGVGWLLWRYL